MKKTTVESSRSRQLLSEAAEWKMLAMLFSCPRDDWTSQVASLAQEVGDPQLQQAAQSMSKEASEGLYHTTFGPGGPAAPREVSHREYMTPGASLAELLSYYEAFAFGPAPDEPPDHVAVECDFMAYLRVKEAYAVARGNEEQATIVVGAARTFATDHLANIAQPLLASLAESGIEYLCLAAQGLLQRVGTVPNSGVSPGVPLPVLTAASPDCRGLDDDELLADPSSGPFT